MSNTRVADGLTPGLNAVGDGLTAPPGVPVPGTPTEWQTESDNGDQETKDEVDKTKDTGDKVKDAEDEIRDDDEEGKKNLDGIGTELSSDSSSGEGTPKVYPASNQTPQQSMPQQSMPQMSMPQMSMPQASMPQVSTPSTPTMSKDLFDKLARNYSPDKGNSSSNSGSSSKFNDPNGVNKSKLDPSEVDINKKGYGVLSTGELETVMDKALDANGITDEKAREQWKDVLKYMAIKESGLNADAVNVYDYNARGAAAADGNPFNCSRGIWQTIPTTFAAYHVSGTSAAIYDPVASGAAAINYISGKYNVNKNGGSSLDAFYAQRGGGGSSYTGY